MKLYNITRYNQEIEKEMAAVYGKPYSFFEKLKLGGVGSPRMFYLSGIKELDDLIYLNQPPITLIEMLRESIFFHIHTNPNAQHYVWALKKDEVKIISNSLKLEKATTLSIDTQSLHTIAFSFQDNTAIFGYKPQIHNPIINYLKKHHLINP
jgi:hypothetical protein